MEAATKPQMTISMMQALTRAHNATIAFKKYRVDVCLKIDPTRTPAECEKCIHDEVDSLISKNAVTGVVLPAAFVPQDYSTQIADLRTQRKVDALNKPSRKTKRAAVSNSDEGESAEVDGDTKGPCKKKKSVEFKKSDEGESDKNEVKNTSSRKKKCVVPTTTEDVEASAVSSLLDSDSEEADSDESGSDDDKTEEKKTKNVETEDKTEELKAVVPEIN
jgi:hypothetical protein